MEGLQPGGCGCTCCPEQKFETIRLTAQIGGIVFLRTRAALLHVSFQGSEKVSVSGVHFALHGPRMWAFPKFPFPFWSFRHEDPSVRRWRHPRTGRCGQR